LRDRAPLALESDIADAAVTVQLNREYDLIAAEWVETLGMEICVI
jgi:hypothetical protein